MRDAGSACAASARAAAAQACGAGRSNDPQRADQAAPLEDREKADATGARCRRNRTADQFANPTPPHQPLPTSASRRAQVRRTRTGLRTLAELGAIWYSRARVKQIRAARSKWARRPGKTDKQSSRHPHALRKPGRPAKRAPRAPATRRVSRTSSRFDPTPRALPHARQRARTPPARGATRVARPGRARPQRGLTRRWVSFPLACPIPIAGATSSMGGWFAH